MPLLADSIVECGRRTLTNAITLANEWGRDSSGKWFGAHVVYGKRRYNYTHVHSIVITISNH